MTKTLYTLFFIISFIHYSHAQNLAVKSFVFDETDLTANLHGTIVLDQNGEKCALIKIFTTATDFTFDVGSLGVQKVEQRTGECLTSVRQIAKVKRWMMVDG